jgi:hypothetical protein
MRPKEVHSTVEIPDKMAEISKNKEGNLSALNWVHFGAKFPPKCATA